MINEKLIYLDLTCSTAEETIDTLAKQLYKNGYVTKDYINAILTREKNYPTGLPTNPGVALPHASSEFVKKSGIAVGLLKDSVDFHEMGGENSKVNIKIVIMLAINEPKEHLDYLQKIMMMIQTPAILSKLNKAKSTNEVYNILKNSNL